MINMGNGYGYAIRKFEPHPMRGFNGASKLGRDLIGSRPAIPCRDCELLGPYAKCYTITLEVPWEIRPLNFESADLDPAGIAAGIKGANFALQQIEGAE